jgi:hypothetical protein
MSGIGVLAWIAIGTRRWGTGCKRRPRSCARDDGRG